MKFTICSLLLLGASAALAIPHSLTKESSSYLNITDFWANTSEMGQMSTMHFILKDQNYRNDTPTTCNLIWPYGSNPDVNARCNNGQYYITFPSGVPDIGHFTMQLERVSGPIAEKGQALLDDNANGDAPGSKWICEQNPQVGVTEHCEYNGVLLIQV